MKLFARLAASFALFGVMAVPRTFSRGTGTPRELRTVRSGRGCEALIDGARKEGALEWTGDS